jgi:hypothetical protein
MSCGRCRLIAEASRLIGRVVSNRAWRSRLIARVASAHPIGASLMWWTCALILATGHLVFQGVCSGWSECDRTWFGVDGEWWG